jgi:bacterioferritin
MPVTPSRSQSAAIATVVAETHWRPDRRRAILPPSAGMAAPLAERNRHMRGDAKVIDYLNRGLRAELTAVNQYWLHYRIFENWGLKDLGKKWREESIEEMRHADSFAERILFLEGFPNMQVLDPMRIGQSVEEILRADLQTEIEARNNYIEAASYCFSVNDRVSEKLFESIIKSEEGHIDFLETQLELIKQLGVQLYSQKHMGELE